MFIIADSQQLKEMNENDGIEWMAGWTMKPVWKERRDVGR